MSVNVAGNAGYILTQQKEVRDRWKQYIKSSYNKDENPKIEDLLIEEKEKIAGAEKTSNSKERNFVSDKKK